MEACERVAEISVLVRVGWEARPGVDALVNKGGDGRNGVCPVDELTQP